MGIAFNHTLYKIFRFRKQVSVHLATPLHASLQEYNFKFKRIVIGRTRLLHIGVYVLTYTACGTEAVFKRNAKHSSETPRKWRGNIKPPANPRIEQKLIHPKQLRNNDLLIYLDMIFHEITEVHNEKYAPQHPQFALFFLAVIGDTIDRYVLRCL
jgi:hypothetical protein